MDGWIIDKFNPQFEHPLCQGMNLKLHRNFEKESKSERMTGLNYTYGLLIEIDLNQDIYDYFIGYYYSIVLHLKAADVCSPSFLPPHTAVPSSLDRGADVATSTTRGCQGAITMWQLMYELTSKWMIWRGKSVLQQGPSIWSKIDKNL